MIDLYKDTNEQIEERSKKQVKSLANKKRKQ